MREINKSGLNLIKSFEQCRCAVYNDGYNFNTVGYGHRTELPIGTPITQEEADKTLLEDLMTAEVAVIDMVQNAIGDNQFAALVSFVFNVGRGAFSKSTLLRELNAGNFSMVPNQLKLWIHSAGKVSEGLKRRREAEIALWNEPDITVTDLEIGMG